MSATETYQIKSIQIKSLQVKLFNQFMGENFVILASN